MILRLIASLEFDVQQRPYCARCGGHYPPHSH